MRIIRSIFFILVVLTFKPSIAQPEQWAALQDSDSLIAYREMNYSENLGMTIHLAGMYLDGNRVIAGYNGDSWQALTDSISGFPNTFADWNGGIVLGGSSSQINGIQMPNAAYYNGQEWTFPWEFNDSVRKFKVINDTLFALGFFTEIDGQDAFKIAKLVGDEWVGMLDPHPELENSGIFGDIEFYNGEYYVCGNFNPDGLPWDFAKLVDGNLEMVGQGVLGALTGVSHLEVYQGDLYLSGLIPIQEGNIGSSILRWDGENYYDLGSVFYNEFGGLSGTGISAMKLHNGYLYCSGNFFFFDETPVYGIARWDGKRWCEMFTQEFIQDTEFYQPVRGFGFYLDTLLLLKVFFYNEAELDFDGVWAYDTNQEPNYCLEPLSVFDQNYSTEFLLYPNPSPGLIMLKSENPIQRFTVFDALGKLVHQENTQYQTQVQLDLSHLPKGLYLVQVEGDGVMGSKKVVLE